MKRLLILILISALFTGCAEDKNIGGKNYTPKGALHFATNKENKCIEYDFSTGNILLGAFTFASVIGPVYFWGFASMNPVSYIEGCKQ